MQQGQVLRGRDIDRRSDQLLCSALVKTHLATENTEPPGSRRALFVKFLPPGGGSTRSHRTTFTHSDSCEACHHPASLVVLRFRFQLSKNFHCGFKCNL